MNLGLTLGLGGRAAGGAAASGFVHVPHYGQSLALGTDPDGASVITTDPVAGSKMFNAGVRAHYDTVGIINYNSYVDQASITSLADLEEQLNPADADLGETLAAGMALRLSGDSIHCAMARGAYRIDQLVPYTPTENTAWLHWSNLYASIMRSRKLAEAAGETWTMGPLLWKQGEADGGAATSKANYKTRMLSLKHWVENSLALAAGADLTDHPIICDQQALSNANYAAIAVAVIELHREYPGVFVVAGPTYGSGFTYTASNDVHLTSVGYRNVGEKYGQVYQAVRGSGWNPCHITGVSRAGSTVTVSIHVPTAPLVKDTTLVAAATNDGFTYSGANITSVTITDDGTSTGTATIEIALDASAGGTLSYAYNNGTAGNIGSASGARGNIRDSDPFTTIYDSTAMPNWLCVDQWVVA